MEMLRSLFSFITTGDSAMPFILALSFACNYFLFKKIESINELRLQDNKESKEQAIELVEKLHNMIEILGKLKK